MRGSESERKGKDPGQGSCGLGFLGFPQISIHHHELEGDNLKETHHFDDLQCYHVQRFLQNSQRKLEQVLLGQNDFGDIARATFSRS